MTHRYPLRFDYDAFGRRVAVVAVKHPGHDQAAHGNWARGGGAGTIERKPKTVPNPHVGDFDASSSEEYKKADRSWQEHVNDHVPDGLDPDDIFHVRDEIHDQLIETLPKETLRLDEVQPTQNWLREDKLAAGADWGDGNPTPALVLRGEDGTNFLADGHHRYHADATAGVEEMEAHVYDSRA